MKRRDFFVASGAVVGCAALPICGLAKVQNREQPKMIHVTASDGSHLLTAYENGEVCWANTVKMHNRSFEEAGAIVDRYTAVFSDSNIKAIGFDVVRVHGNVHQITLWNCRFRQGSTERYSMGLQKAAIHHNGHESVFFSIK